MTENVIEQKSSGPLSDVLVMLAPYGAECRSTADFVSMLQTQGATIVKTQAKAEVSLTRCVLAAAAYDVFRTSPHLQWAFWLDQDVSGSMGSVAALIDIARAIEGPGGMAPTVSGTYVNRHTTPPRVAAYAIRRSSPVAVKVRLGNQLCDLEVVPSLCGMGALLQHRMTFMQHCDESEHFAFPNRETLVPEVCSSHRVHSSEFARFIELPEGEDLYYWMSEDFDYCAREFEHGRSVYTVPVPFGHECSQVLVPNGVNVFPGLRQPDATHVEAG